MTTNELLATVKPGNGPFEATLRPWDARWEVIVTFYPTDEVGVRKARATGSTPSMALDAPLLRVTP